MYTRLWSSKIEDALKLRFDSSAREMERIMEDIKSYPITYNHYYTDKIKKRRREREEKSLANCIDNATDHVKLPDCHSDHTSAQVDSRRAVREYYEELNPDMENHSCEEALDCLHSIYKVSEVVHCSGHCHLLTLISSPQKPSSTTSPRKSWSDILCAAWRKSFL